MNYLILAAVLLIPLIMPERLFFKQFFSKKIVGIDEFDIQKLVKSLELKEEKDARTF